MAEELNKRYLEFLVQNLRKCIMREETKEGKREADEADAADAAGEWERAGSDSLPSQTS